MCPWFLLNFFRVTVQNKDNSNSTYLEISFDQYLILLSIITGTLSCTYLLVAHSEGIMVAALFFKCGFWLYGIVNTKIFIMLRIYSVRIYIHLTYRQSFYLSLLSTRFLSVILPLTSNRLCHAQASLNSSFHTGIW